MTELIHDCSTCEHEHDSNNEYCGCCDDITYNYKEAGWHIKNRLYEQIVDQQAEIERIRKLYDEQVLMRTKDVQELGNQIADQQNLIDQLVKACEKWMLVESEMSNKTPCPDLALRSFYRSEAVRLTNIALASAEKLKGKQNVPS